MAPRSPDSTPCNFFLWGYLKDRVYSAPLQNITALRGSILNQVQTLRPQGQLIRRTFQTMQNRARICLQQREGHVEIS